MLLIRRFEERAGQLYGMGLIGGFCHLYIGQEAVVVGMQAAIERRATQSSPPTATTATCWPRHGPQGRHGRADRARGGYSKGKGGSMHMFSREKSFYGGHGIVGAQVPLGTGLALRPQVPRRRQGLAAPISATARPTRARSTRASTWPRCGSCRSSTSSRTTSTPWAPASSAPRPITELYRRGESFGIPGRAGRRHGRAGGAGGRREGRRACPQRQGPLHPRDEDLPLSRPLDVATRPSTGPRKRSTKYRNERDPIDHVRKTCSTRRLADEAELKAIDAEIKRDRRRRGRVRPAQSRARSVRALDRRPGRRPDQMTDVRF